jgi:Transposase DDE domain
MNAFTQELMRRSPLASCVLELCDFMFADELLTSIWEEHRGRCYEDQLRFAELLELMRDALTRHRGSAHKLFVELERRDAQPVDESNFYRKLARTPVDLSRALLREGTAKLAGLMPADAVTLPVCFDRYAVIVGDGKKVKDAAKRLAPTRGFSGKLIGAKALVALDVRSGLAVAMSDSLDGLTNDVPLVPLLMPQLRQIIERPILSVWDRQFGDLRTFGHLTARAGDAFVVRASRSQAVFTAETVVKTADAKGRVVIDEIGVMGRGSSARPMRRITLERDGEAEDDVVLLTNLLDRVAFCAADLLALYKERWGIERVFQQVTETFSLSHLIGSSPKAVLLQLAFCLLLYNLMQLVKACVAQDGGVLASVVSMFYLFDDTRKELEAWAYHGQGQWTRTRRDAASMRERLRELLNGSWNPVAYTKASDKQPRPKPPPKRLLHGGHSSVQRLLEGKIKLANS